MRTKVILFLTAMLPNDPLIALAISSAFHARMPAISTEATMISILCKILRPLCVIATLAIMALLIALFWGYEIIPTDYTWRLLISYGVLLLGSFIIFYVDNPQDLFRAKKQD